VYGTSVERLRVSSSLHPGRARFPNPLTTRTVLFYEAQLNHEYRKSIPYFEEKNNPVKHILALCSILWQGNQEKVSERVTKRYSINAVPRYAT